jgi:hypothetical protein
MGLLTAKAEALAGLFRSGRERQSRSFDCASVGRSAQDDNIYFCMRYMTMFDIYIMKRRPKVVLILISIAAVIVSAQSTTEKRGPAQGYWVDPTTGLMWVGRDNGKDVSWKGAVKYCRKLRLAGFSDWRLANAAELGGIYDKSVEAPGLAGYRNKQRDFTWHVKGNLFLTGDLWANNYREDDRGKNSGYEFYFDFNSGEVDNQPGDFPYPFQSMRALCVRRAG